MDKPEENNIATTGSTCSGPTAQGTAANILISGSIVMPTGAGKSIYDPLPAPYPPTETGATTIHPTASDPFAEWQKRRDEFAKAAMVKLLEKKSLTFDEIAQMAYFMADKMIEQSVKSSSQEKDDKGLEPPKAEEEPMIPMDITIDGKGPDEPQKDSCADSDFQSVLKALDALVYRIDLVLNSDEYRQVWACHQHHIGYYHGPDYLNELAMARSILNKFLYKEHKKP